MNEKATYTIDLKDLFSNKLKGAANGIDNFEKKVNKLSGSNGMGGSLNGLSLAFARLFSVAAIGAGVKKLSDLAATAESTRIAYQVMLGDIKKGDKLLGELKNYANITPYVSADVLQAGQTLLAYGVDAEKILPTIKMLGDVAMGDAERLKHVSLVFGQVMSAGRLMGQDLLQLVNLGFNPLQVMSQKTGLSMAVLKKKMEDGAISSREVARAFKIATSEGGLFYQMTEKQSQTFGGKMSTAIDLISVKLTDMGTELNKVLGPVLDKILSILDKTGTVKGEAKKYGEVTGSLRELEMLRDEYNGAPAGSAGKSLWEQKILDKYPLVGSVFSKEFGAKGIDQDKLSDQINLLAKQQYATNPENIFNDIVSKNSAKISDLQKKLSSPNANMFQQLVGGKSFSDSERMDMMTQIGKLNQEVVDAKTELTAFQAKGGRKTAMANLIGNKGGGAGDFDLNGSGKKHGGDGDGLADARLGGTKSITINVASLIKELNVSNQTDDIKKIVDAVQKSLIIALNDANLALG